MVPYGHRESPLLLRLSVSESATGKGCTTGLEQPLSQARLSQPHLVRFADVYSTCSDCGHNQKTHRYARSRPTLVRVRQSTHRGEPCADPVEAMMWRSGFCHPTVAHRGRPTRWSLDELCTMLVAQHRLAGCCHCGWHGRKYLSAAADTSPTDTSLQLKVLSLMLRLFSLVLCDLGWNSAQALLMGGAGDTERPGGG
jgi:hypothetical protein